MVIMLAALVAAVFSVLTYCTLSSTVEHALQERDALQLGGMKNYEALEQLYRDNADIFSQQGEQLVQQTEQQIQMYRNSKATATGADATQGGAAATDNGAAMMVATGAAAQ